MLLKLFIILSIIIFSPIWSYYYVKLLGEIVDRRIINGNLTSTNSLFIPRTTFTPFEEILCLNEQNTFILVIGFGFYYFMIPVIATIFFFHHVFINLFK